MQLKSVQQPEQSYKYFQENMASSKRSLQVFKQFLQGVHQLCKKFGEDLQHLYQLVNVQVDDEENLAQNTILSNYILSISQVIKNRSDMLYEESIEPFLQFEENYSQLNENLDQEYSKIISDLKQNHEILKFKQLEYFEKGKKQIFGDSEQQYRIALSSMNSSWDEYFKKSHQLFNNFQLNDESRVSVVEQATFKFLEVMELMFKQPIKIPLQRLKNSFINQKQKMKNRDLFLEMTTQSKRLIEFFKEPKCDQYYSRDDYFKIQSQALLQQAQSSGNQKLNDDDFQVLRYALEGPINKPTPIFHKLRLQNNFTFKEREDIIIQIESFLRQNNYVLDKYSQITLYKLLFIKLLQSIDQDIFQLTQKDVIQILQIMYIGYRICIRKKSLLESCSRHAELFKTRIIWINIQEEITVNVQQQKIMIEQAKKFVNIDLCINSNIQLPKIEAPQKDNILNLGLKLFQMEKEKRILPIEALSLTNVMLLSTYIAPEYSYDILSNLIKQHNIKESDVLNQLELQESNYLLKPFRNSSRRKLMEEKLIQRKKKSIYCLFKCLKFLNMSKDFIKIICISKEYSKEIRDKMIGYHLMNKSVRLNLGPRVNLWKILLDTDSSFNEVSQRFMLSSQKLSSQTEHSIMVDIKRSFNTSQNLRNQIIESYETKLQRLLRLIAYDNPEVSYFQGMNMLMVFLLYVTNLDEDVTFKLFKSLLDKMLRDIFLEGLKIMRKHFFVLDRLMAIYLPDLFKYWRKLKIESPQFATAWYVTLFTYSIQLEDQAANTTCLDMFDVIVAKGWAGFYRVTIALLSYYSNVFLKLDFDQTHKFLNQLTKSSFNLNCQAQEFADVHPFTDIKKRIIQIKKSTIQEIEKQYYWFRNKIDIINYNK